VAAAIVLLLLRDWVAAGSVAALSVTLLAVQVVLARRADPAELRARSEEGERWMEEWGRAMGGFSGAWDPPSRSKRKPAAREESGRRE
jgi:hypothetical protein